MLGLKYSEYTHAHKQLALNSIIWTHSLDIGIH